MHQVRLFMLACGLACCTLLGFVGIAAARVPSVEPVAAPAAFATPRTTFPIVDTAPITRALAYLNGAQRNDGGFVGFTPGQSDDFTSVRVAFALGAARLPGDYLLSDEGKSVHDYLTTRAYSYTHDLQGRPLPGRLGMLIVAAVAGDANPMAYGTDPTTQPLDLVAALTATYQPATGAYSSTASLGFSSGAAGPLNQAYALLGLAAAQQALPSEQALTYLIDLQDTDGSWGFGFGGDVDTTALIVQALLANGVAPTAPVIQDALGFLATSQIDDGSWGFDGTPNADSTAAVIQAAAATGFFPVTLSWQAANGNPQTALLALQQADGGFGNALGTANAIPGLAEAPLPIFSSRQRAERALAWLQTTQTSSGGWASFGTTPDVGATLDVMLAFSAAGFAPDSVSQPGGASALAFLRNQVFTYTRVITTAGDVSTNLFPAATGKALLGIVAAGEDPTAFAASPGVTLNLVTDLQATLRPTGAYSTTAVRGFSSGAATPLSQAFAILGLRAAGEAIPDEALDFLRQRQNAEDGSWGSVDTTGLVIQALVAAGVTPNDPTIAAAVAFLRTQQDALGGWDNPNSTAYAIQGLIAADEDLRSNWRKAGRSPFDALGLYQRPDGPLTYTWEEGSFFTPGTANAFATWQAVPALLARSYPLPTGTDLTQYVPVLRGPNPDRLVVRPTTGRWGNSIAVSLPFGGDLNGDATAELAWRAAGATEWLTATLTRAPGVFTATLPVTMPRTYELRTIVNDSDGVQAGNAVSTTLTTVTTVEPFRMYLPLVLR